MDEIANPEIPVAIKISGNFKHVKIKIGGITKYFLGRYFNKWLSGYTGDCLGAAQQITEIIFYLQSNGDTLMKPFNKYLSVLLAIALTGMSVNNAGAAMVTNDIFVGHAQQNSAKAQLLQTINRSDVKEQLTAPIITLGVGCHMLYSHCCYIKHMLEDVLR